MTVFSAAVLFFLVLDPFGNIPFFLSALDRVEQGRRRRVVARELLVALAVLVLFLFTGQWLLRLLGIAEPALTLAGGIILFLIALRMIFPASRPHEEEIEGEPFIVPLAVPYVAGPSAMASVLFIMNRDPGRWPEWLAAVLLAWGATGAILFFASGLSRHLGRRGLVAMERLMGMVLTALAVQMFMSGVSRFLHL
ncbi:MAG TPA: MarC family protein [Thermoanaerobaculia bacterium]